MASESLTLDEIRQYFVENGGKVSNKDAVRHFKHYLTNPATKEESRKKFKQYINMLAHTKQEGTEKILILRTNLNTASQSSLSSLSTSTSSLHMPPAVYDPRNAIGIPTSPPSTSPRQPPPYRNPPPVHSPSPSLDSISLSSSSTQDERPQAPPRKRSGILEEHRSNSISNLLDNDEGEEKEVLSVKERTQKFNRMASTEDELSPRVTKSAEKDRSKLRGVEDTSILTPLEPKKCQEWYVTASRGDCQELLRLAKVEPRLVNKKDPFTAYTVLHWGAKYGNAEIIKIFAGTYKVDVNGRTNGGYTPLHISAQFNRQDIYRILIEVYKADPTIRDYSGKMPEYYLMCKQQKENTRSEYKTVNGKASPHSRADRKGKSFRNKTISFPTDKRPMSSTPITVLFQNYPTYPGIAK